MQKTGVAIETQGFTFVTSGRKRESLTVSHHAHLSRFVCVRKHFDAVTLSVRTYPAKTHSGTEYISYRDVTVVPTFFVRMLGKLLDACI